MWRGLNLGKYLLQIGVYKVLLDTFRVQFSVLKIGSLLYFRFI